MNKNRPTQKNIFTYLILSALILSLLTGFCGCKKDGRIYPDSGEELDGLRAASVIGTLTGSLTEEFFPNSTVSYFKNFADILEAIQNDKVDYALSDEVSLNIIMEETSGYKLLDLDIYWEDLALFTSKDPSSDPLREEFNDYLSEITKTGYLKELQDKWIHSSSKEYIHYNFDDIHLTGEKGTFCFATEPYSVPYSFYSNNELSGLTIELVLRFAQARGYNVDFLVVDFDGLIPAVLSGKCAMGGSVVAITEERKESVNFTDPYYSDKIVAIAADPDSGANVNGFVDAFKRSFIEEKRWEMVLEGFVTTLIIVISSLVFGTVLGFLFYLSTKKKNPVLKALFDGLSWLLGSLPTIVTLMVLYYVIFGTSSVSGTFIACVAFTIFMACIVYSLLKTSVASVGNDQLEGALSMGCDDQQAFFRVILPQSMTQFLPNYIAEVISLVKSTAIVGYIAVPDLTKASDVIRSRTFEAFVPIIATAIIYVLIITLFTILLKTIAFKIDPTKRSEKKVLKKYLP